MTKGQVSIIMPTYNDYHFLPYAVESIIKQTYDNWELIIVDSSDEPSKVKGILPSDEGRIHYLYREKKGIADALNFATKNSTGEYIARMDADDISVKERMEYQVDYLKMNTSVDIVSSSMDVIDEKGNLLEEVYFPQYNDEILARLIFENPICHPSVMVRRKVFEGETYRNVAAEDYDLWTRLVGNKRFYVDSRKLIKYRKHGKNLSIVNLKRVSQSTCKSAKAMLIRLFGEEFAEFEEDIFAPNYCLIDILYEKLNREDYVINQFKMLRILWQVNNKKNVFNNKNLEEEILKRWNLLMRNQTILSVKLNKFSVCTKMALFQTELKELVKAYQDNKVCYDFFLQGDKTFYVYGIGFYGKQLLKIFEKKQFEIGNRFLGVIDKTKQRYVYREREYNTYNIDEIDKNVDYIIITPKNAFAEIEKKLIEKGYCRESIIGDLLFYE